MLEKDNIR